MIEEAVLMENTVISSYTRYNDKVFKRNRRFFRKVSRDELTSAMCASAGIPVPDEVRAKEAKPVFQEMAAPVDPVAPVAPVAPVDPVAPVAPVAPEAPRTSRRPDTTGWSEDQLRDFTQDNDIPIHPSAKAPGMKAAITRYFDELESINSEGE